MFYAYFDTYVTRIPSGIWPRLYGSFPSALNTWLFDPESLYEPI